MFRLRWALKCFLSIVILVMMWAGDCHALEGESSLPGDWAQINLTDQQLQWLCRNNILRLGVGLRFVPIMFVEEEDGKLKFAGMVADYVKLFEKRLGVTMKPVMDISFKEALEMGRQGKIDLYPCVTETPSRKDLLVYTKPYLVFPLVIITRKDFEPITGLDELVGKRVAVVKELSTYGMLKRDYPGLDFKLEKDIPSAFEAVSLGRADACVYNLAVAGYYIQKMGLMNLKIAAPTSYGGDLLSVGVRKDLPVLRDIMGKVVASITPEEHNRIHSKWISVRFEHGLDWILITQAAATLGLIVILILAVILTWNKRLAREAGARKSAETAAKESAYRLRTLINSMPDMICFKDGQGRWLEANDNILELFLISLLDYKGKTDLELAQYSPFYREAFEVCDLSDAQAWLAGRPSKFDEVLPVMDGPPKVFEFIKVPTYHENGERKGMVVVGRDVTARKKTEDALRDSEEKYRKTFESISEAISITRMSDGQYLFVNDGFTRQTGWLGREILGRTIVDIDIYANPANRDRIIGILNVGGDVLDMEMRLRRKSGELYYAAVSAKALSYGGEDCIISQIRDITPRVEAVKALAKSEETYRNLINNSPLGVFQSIPDGRYRMVNPAFAHMMGFASPEQMTEEVRDISTLYMDPKDRQRFVAHLDRHGGAVDYELHLRRRDGSQMWMTTFTKVVRDEEGRLAYLDGFALDITERKLAHAAVAETKQQFDATFEQAAVGLDHLSLDGKFLRVNRKFCDLLGYSRDELLGLHLLNITHSDDVDKSKRLLKNLLTGQTQSFSMEKRYVRKDGALMWGNVTASLVRDDDGNPKYFVGVLEDITSRKKADEEKAELELQLRQSKKMQAIGTLAGGVAHDFNNILATIMGYSELALSYLEKDGKGTSEVSEILRSADRAKELVQQILTFSRKVEVDLKPLDLNHEVAHCAKILERTLPKMIALRTHLDINLPQIKADATQIEQVILNLATNAADAMPDGGRLVIETSPVRLDREYCRHHLEVAPGEYVLLQVSDTGCGMDEYTCQQAFDPFFTTKDVGKGTGLGLSTVFGIVKEHGGHIHCYSEQGQGTSFKIYLPVKEMAPEVESEQEEVAGQEALGGNETVLLVDDEQALRKLGRSMLGDAGYRVVTAKDGEEAVEKYLRKMPGIDLIVLDLSMPGMGGLKCMGLLLEADPEAKVLIASGYSANATAQDTIKAGAVGFISKPFRSEELLAQIRQALDKD